MIIGKILKFNIVRPIKRRLTTCCLLLALSILLACGLLFGLSFYLARLAAAQTSGQTPYEILLLIDNSNSMYEKEGPGSDPELLRIQAARLFITYLGIDSGGLVHRLGVIFFGGEARLVVPLTPLTDNARRAELAQLIANPQRMAWTNPQAALELAEQTFASTASPSARRALVLLTDGKPEWSNSPTPDERQNITAHLRETAQRLATKDISLFIILLQNEAATMDPELEQVYVPLWQEMAAATPIGRFYRARQSEELLDIYHELVVTLMQQQTAGVVIQTETQTETVESVWVEPNLAQVTFVIRKSQPTLQVKILRPDGQVLGPADLGVQHGGQPGQSLEEIWAILKPSPGRWQVQINGQGSVTVWKDFQPAPPMATPTFTPQPTATFTPRPTSTSTPLPATTPAPQPTPSSTPTKADMFPAIATTPQHPNTPTPHPSAGSGQVPSTSPGIGFRTSPANSPNLWQMSLPLVILAIGSAGWFWFRSRQARPLLTGLLRQIAAPLPAGATLSTQLDLDRLGRRAIILGPTAGASLHLPNVPNQPTPTVRLIARLDAEGQPGVALIPETGPTKTGPVQVNGLSVVGERFLYDSDVITLGAYRFKYENLRQRRSSYRGGANIPITNY